MTFLILCVYLIILYVFNYLVCVFNYFVCISFIIPNVCLLILKSQVEKKTHICTHIQKNHTHTYKKIHTCVCVYIYTPQLTHTQHKHKCAYYGRQAKNQDKLLFFHSTNTCILCFIFKKIVAV